MMVHSGRQNIAEDVAAAILSERLRADGHGRMPDSEA